MIQSLDPVGPGQRLEPIFLEGRGPLINAEQARLLGLRNGQVIQAVIDKEGSAFSVLWPAGQRSGLPRALEAFPLPSQWRWAPGSLQEVVALLMPGGFIQLRPVKTGPNAALANLGPNSSAPQASGSRPSSSAVGGASSAALGGGSAAGSAIAAAGLPAQGPGQATGLGASPYTLGQAFALAQGLLPGAAEARAGQAPAPAGPPPGASAELARLLQQAPTWATLMQVLKDLMGDDLGEAQAEGHEAPVPLPLARLADLLGGALPRMGQLTPAALQQAMARSGLGAEAALLAGSGGLDQDLKVALRRYQRSLPVGSTAAEGRLGRAVDTLERSQIDTLTAQMQGQVLLSMVIPFGDAGPVALRLYRERAKRDEAPPPFVVDVYSGHSGLGPLWLRTQVAADRRVSMTMWALRPEVAQQAREQSRALRLNLSQSGLVLSGLEIVTGAPAVEEMSWAEVGGRP